VRLFHRDKRASTDHPLRAGTIRAPPVSEEAPRSKPAFVYDAVALPTNPTRQQVTEPRDFLACHVSMIWWLEKPRRSPAEYACALAQDGL